MVYLFYTIYISVDLAYRAKIGKGGIKQGTMIKSYYNLVTFQGHFFKIYTSILDSTKGEKNIIVADPIGFSVRICVSLLILDTGKQVLWQTVKTQMKYGIRWHFIRVFTLFAKIKAIFRGRNVS